MPITHAAENLAVNASSRQLTLTTLLLIVLFFVAMIGFVTWSWQQRQTLARQRRDAEAALRSAEGRLSHLSSQLPIALFQFEAGRFTYVSSGLARLMPCTAAEAIANPKNFLDVIEPEDKAGLAWVDGKVAEVADLEWTGRILNSETTPRWLQIHASTDIGRDGVRMVNGIVIDITPIKLAHLALERSQAELRQLAAYREMRVEQERQRLAREFHDELGQVLTAARMQLQLLARNPADGNVATIEGLIADAYRSVKTIAADLRPPALNMGLTAAVEWLSDRLLGPANIRCSINFASMADDLPEHQAIGLFRIIQESINNIVRHARASQIWIDFVGDDRQLRLTIRDNGCGFEPHEVDRTTHFGLLGLAERTSALGGQCVIDSHPGGGTTLTITLPTC